MGDVVKFFISYKQCFYNKRLLLKFLFVYHILNHL